MKSIRSLCLAATALCCATVSAHDFEVDGIYYNITSETDLTVEVTYKGSYSSEYSDEYTGEVEIPGSVTYNEKTYSVMSIGDWAFNGCSGLTSVTIPNSVTSIGISAFNDSGLTSITIPNSVTSIGDAAFYDCTGLTNIIIPESVTSIGSNTFYYCLNLTSVTLGNSVETIEESAFVGCESLANIIFPNSLKSIGEYAFGRCLVLTELLIPKSVEKIEDFAFTYCPNLISIVVDDENIVYDSRHDCNAIIETQTNTLILGCPRTQIPDGIVSLGNGAFSKSRNLTNMTIPNTVTNLGKEVFLGCVNLVELTLPSSVSSVGSSTFYDCTKLQNIIVNNPTPFSVSTMSFFNSSATLTVPNGSAKAYNDLGGFWSQFTTIKEKANIKIPEANKWSTCALAFDAALPEGVRAFVSTGMEENYVLLEEVTSLEANTPYVLYAQNGYESTLSGTVDVVNYQTSVTDGALNGAITQQTISEGYVLQNQGEGSKFYNVNGQTFIIPAGKCWLSAVSASGARSVMMRFPGGATDIEGLYVERPAETDGKIYTLDGVEVETMQSGHIYIKDGKKVLKR